MGFIKTVIKRPVTIFMIIVCILLFGVMALFNMPVTLLPDMNMPMLTVVTAYPGASPDDIESDVTAVLEKELRTVSGITEIMTYSLDNASAVMLQFEFGSDMSEIKETVRSKLELVPLPSGCEDPIIQNIDLNAISIAKVAVRADGGAEDAVKDTISPAIESIPGVSSVTAVGVRESRVDITPKEGYESFVGMIMQAVSVGGYDIPLGSVNNKGEVITVRNISEVTSLAELKKLPVPFPVEGLGLTYLDLEDIAHISQPYDVYPNGRATINGESCILLNVYKLQDGNTTNIVGKIKEAIASNSKGGIELTLVDDQSEYISDSISSVWSSLFIGAILAFIIIILFLANVRSSLIISLSMPLSILLAMICLFALNVSLNMVSLGGLALGIGMLVDNSIVVIESITRRKDAGESPKEAAANGTRSVAGAILASTLTSVAVFVPIMFVKGMTEEIFRDLSLSVIFSLVFSLLVALTIIPTMYAKFGGRTRKDRKKTADTEVSSAGSEVVAVGAEVSSADTEVSAESPTSQSGENHGVGVKKPNRIRAYFQVHHPMIAAENGYGKFLSAALTKRWLVLVLAVVLFGASVMLLFTTGQEFLPSMERGVVEVTVAVPSGNLADTEKKLNQVANRIDETFGESIENLTTSIDTGSMLNLGTEGSISIKLKSGAKRSEDFANDIREAVKDIPDAAIQARPIDGVVEMLMNGVSGVSISVGGKDEAVLAEIRDKIVPEIEKIEGVTSVGDNLSQKQTQYQIHIDQTVLMREAALRGMGDTLTYDALVKSLRVGLAGMDVNATIDGVGTSVGVSFDKNRFQSREELENLVLIPHFEGILDAPALTLKDVLREENGVREIKEVEVSSVIKKLNGEMTLEISVDLYGVDSGTVQKQVKKIADSVLADYEGYSFADSGVSMYLGEAFSGLVVALVISIFLVFAIMASQFESLKKPFIIMFSIPFSFTGGFLALAITGTTLNVVSFIGVIMLIGIIVNNAIVMIDKIEQLKAEGMDHYEAVVEGTKSRLRPILMTTLTTVLALVPLAFGIGKGSELLQPMGVVVIGGLLLGTLVTLVLIPTVYTLLAKVKIKKSKKTDKETESPNE